MVTVSRVQDIIRTGQVVAVVCSTTFDPDDILPDEIVIPCHPEGKCLSQLREPTVAVCDWTASFDATTIDDMAGMVPPALLKEICRAAGIVFVPER